jgi:hypothetical protein
MSGATGLTVSLTKGPTSRAVLNGKNRGGHPETDMEFEFDPPIDIDVEPRYYQRKEPHDQHVRRGRSPFWFAYCTDCVQCGKFFGLCWPMGVSHVELHDIIHLECPHCHFDFTRQAHKLSCAWVAAGLRMGHVRRIESSALTTQ